MPYSDPEKKKANDRANYLRRRELRIARARAQALADPEEYRQRMRAYYEKKGRETIYRNLYGIGIEDYDRMLAEQGGRCAICGASRPSTKRKRFAVDHDHRTGKARALLCIRCNSHLGWFERLQSAVLAYVVKHAGVVQ